MKLSTTKILTSILLVSGIAFGACTPSSEEANKQEISQQVAENQVPETPARPAELNGVIRSIEGNEIVMANELREETLTEEEQDTRKEERASMTQEERQALRQEELEAVETESVTLIVPVGTPVIKGSGTSDGSNLGADFSELKSGVYISVWQVEDGSPEIIKIKGTN